MPACLKNIVIISSFAALSFLFMGCGNRGTGVVLWPSENSHWEPGDLVTVKDESFLRNTYIVNLPNQRRLKEEIDQWRLRLFRREKNAAVWAASLIEWRHVYAECLFQGLPMRSEPSNTASRVYRFRKGDLIKVLNREPGPVQVGNLEGYWYYVMADGGIEGYVFDYHLLVMRMEGENRIILNEKDTDDPVLDDILARPWRPQYFGDMITDRRINLDLFRLEYGLFPNTQEKKLTLKLPGTSLVETWSEIVPAGRNRYDFLDTSFRITVNSENFIGVQYTDNGTEHYEAFIRLNHDIPTIIEEERIRRIFILKRLVETGPVFDSRAYGTLTILEDGNFTWFGKSSLISRGVLTSITGNSGRLEFDHFLSPSLAGTYEGVLSFRFGNGEAVRFLYTYEENGIQLLYVPNTAINRRQVRTDQYLDPVRLFFAPLPPVESGEDIPLTQL